jgi:hypothetical protein
MTAQVLGKQANHSSARYSIGWISPEWLRSLLSRAVEGAATGVDRAWISYSLLLLLQFKVIWGDWQYRDLTTGDTASYFVDSYAWFRDGRVEFLWSPLYTAFYGSLLHFSPDAGDATYLHRIIVVFAATLLVLAIARRLVPAGPAWLIGAWWALAHGNFNVMYEVHLFGIIPVLLAVLVAALGPGVAYRGVALALLGLTTLLLRNELIVATMLFGTACLAREISLARRSGPRFFQFSLSRLICYGLPLVVLLGVCIFFYGRSRQKLPEFPSAMSAKTTLAFCQLYAVGYQQRHPDWTLNPYTHCWGLMSELFGATHLTALQATVINPTAMFEHVCWNSKLVPSAVQVGLFNSTSDAHTPDLRSVPLQDPAAFWLSMLMLATLLSGGVLVWRAHPVERAAWFGRTSWSWVALASFASVSVAVAPLLRPRPEYIYGLLVVLMAAVGLAATVVTRRLIGPAKLRLLMPICILAVLILAPGYHAHIHEPSQRTLLTTYRQLLPYADIIGDPETKLLAGEFGVELMQYIGGPQDRWAESRVLHYNILSERGPAQPLGQFLDSKQVNLLHVDPYFLDSFSQDPLIRDFLMTPEGEGWLRIGSQVRTSADWYLFQRVDSPGSAS